jgi:hypothetical protein
MQVHDFLNPKNGYQVSDNNIDEHDGKAVKEKNLSRFA